MSLSTSNSWLRGQRKSDLVEVADSVGLTNYESLKKAELEVALDKYLSQNATTFSSEPKVAGYFQSQAKARGSPVKREPAASDEADTKPIRVTKRRVTKAPEEFEAAE
ncbi:uncharacterized protein DNG_09315 [Cephalotrichum gorgonifer]|uniref:Uncharacterized protein n=1 Tax=Cephalotrichum gorgonifer TaxID=2041049 RepID=A0AAE8N6N1_9PEZI|nr:uncharacterized protein DNG_09315 [Cephalotrichum gorgonifer]